MVLTRGCQSLFDGCVFSRPNTSGLGNSFLQSFVYGGSDMTNSEGLSGGCHYANCNRRLGSGRQWRLIINFERVSDVSSAATRSTALALPSHVWGHGSPLRNRDLGNGYFGLGEEPACEGMSSGGGGSRRGFSSRAWSRTSFKPLFLIALFKCGVTRQSERGEPRVERRGSTGLT